MGVQGLWQLIESSGKPVNLESLEGKKLAVDVSIWLNQSIKGMRDRHGNTVANAHLLSLFHRVCKLLFYRIKPVFVFDGGVPALKKQTLAARRQTKETAEKESGKVNQKMLDNLLRSHALKAFMGQTGDSHAGPSTSDFALPPPKSTDMYALPPLPREEQKEPPDDFPNTGPGMPVWEELMSQRELIQEQYQDLSSIDIHSDDFKNLPPEIQHEILTDLKETRKRTNWAKLDELPEDSLDFSNYQVKKLLKQNKLTQHIENVCQEMNKRASGQLAFEFTGGGDFEEVDTRRIASEDASHMILVKGLSKNKTDDADITDSEIKLGKPMKDRNNESSDAQSGPSKEVSLSVEKTVVGDAANGLNASSFSGVDVEITKSPESSETQIGVDQILAKDKCNSREILEKDLSESVSMSQDGHELRQKANSKDPDIILLDDVEGPVGLEKGNSDIVCLNTIAGRVEGKTTNNKLDEMKYENKCMIKEEKHSEIKKKVEDHIKNIPVEIPINDSSSESEDEGFIEITIDPTNAKPDDDLFPASIFETGAKDINNTTSEVLIDEELLDESMSNQIQKIDKEDERPKSMAAEFVRSTTNTHDVDIKGVSSASEFQGLNKSDLQEMQIELEMETKQLKTLRGQQERIASSVTDQMYIEAQELLQLFGVPYLVSPMEAEAQCAQLDQLDLTNGSVTDDSDIWLFGGRKVYKNFFNQNRHVEEYSNAGIEQKFALDRNKLICVALICGSDYTVGIRGAGPITALEILTEFPGKDVDKLEEFRIWWEEAQSQPKTVHQSKIKSQLRKLQLPTGFPSDTVVQAYLKPTVDTSDEPFTWGEPDVDLLREFAAKKFGWSRGRTDEILGPVLKQRSKTQNQARIERYFHAGVTDSRTVKSKRMKRAIDKFKSPEDEDVDPDVSTTKVKKTKKMDSNEAAKQRATKIKQTTELDPNKAIMQRATNIEKNTELDTNEARIQRAKEILKRNPIKKSKPIKGQRPLTLGQRSNFQSHVEMPEEVELSEPSSDEDDNDLDVKGQGRVTSRKGKSGPKLKAKGQSQGKTKIASESKRAKKTSSIPTLSNRTRISRKSKTKASAKIGDIVLSEPKENESDIE